MTGVGESGRQKFDELSAYLVMSTDRNCTAIMLEVWLGERGD
jgi:hypothetical protein